eukprot:SAG31_NODE_402_length_16197_cov_5.262425_10_plen_66_part_00
MVLISRCSCNLHTVNHLQMFLAVAAYEDDPDDLGDDYQLPGAEEKDRVSSRSVSNGIMRTLTQNC